jgi:alkylation response protein AidB-like acyl-CoA dehydrogenase
VIYEAPVKDMVFLVDEWLGMDKISAVPGHEDVDRDTFQFILEEAGKFCTNELLPINREGDEHGAIFEDGTVRAPPGFKAAYDKLVEGGWTGIDADPEFGGQGLPKLIQYLIDEMQAATNLSFKLYAELSHGAYHLLANSASEELRNRYVPNMVEGTWGGTMCLTEPQSGSDLSLIKSKASSNENGTFAISGSKLFITSGDHDLTENIIHLVLARITGAPAGVRGISLFAVPKFLVNEDGSLGARNGVVTTSIEHKMGIRGSATCALSFDQATGYLVGDENRGVSTMFRMMNMERLTIGLQGLGFAEIAFQNARKYALERSQSKAPAPRPDDRKAADPIIYQPEIMRMLMNIRSQTEGGRALAVLACHHVDVMERSLDEETKANAADLVALLTPVVKSYLTELAINSTYSAQQVYGGHGYVREHGMEQLFRDARVTPIYEGTNEIHAIDLVARKMTGRVGQCADRLFDSWQALLADNREQSDVSDIVASADTALSGLREATEWIRNKLESDEAAARGAACSYQRMFALTAIACLWVDVVVSIRGKTGAFYEGKRKTARFFAHHVLPETESLFRVVTTGAESLAAFSAEDFSD